MRLHALMLLAAGLLVAADALANDLAKKDLDQLQGTWLLVGAERDGKALPAEEVKKTKITFMGDKFVFPGEAGIGTSKMGIINVDPTKKPKWMNSTASNDGDKGKLSLGIYEIQGDDYKVCFAPPGKERPADFVSKQGTGHVVQIWKRAKK